MIYNYFSHLNFKYNHLLGSGSQGDVYQLSDPEKVIKFSVIVDDDNLIDKKDLKENYIKVMSFLKKSNFPCFPKIYEFGVVEKDKLYAYCVMEKLFKLSVKEEDLFESLNDYLTFRYSNMERVKSTITNYIEKRKMKVNMEKIMDFYTQVICSPVEQGDFAGPNFMRDNNFNYKVIDFDRATLNF